MIKTFKCKDTEALWNGQRVARFANVAGVALRKLQQVNAASTLGFLRSPLAIGWNRCLATAKANGAFE